jgi:hypothetical protein
MYARNWRRSMNAEIRDRLGELAARYESALQQHESALQKQESEIHRLQLEFSQASEYLQRQRLLFSRSSSRLICGIKQC